MKTMTAILTNVEAQQGAQAQQQAGTPCPCGCAPCDETCCTLECQVQPRFFCGQLLTDADLNQLLAWSKAKFRLKRYLQGWGIVCGLEVGLDPEHPDHVVVQPGYAIDCCGRDIVACESVSFDLSAACPPIECAEPTFNRWGETAPASKGQGRGAQAAYATTTDEPATDKSSPFDLFSGNTAFDLYLRYQTEETDPQVALRREACGQAGECEASRIKESFTVSFQSATEEEQREKQAISKWDDQYAKLQDKYMNLVDLAYGKMNNNEPLKAWLQDRLQRYPLEEFGFIRDWISAAAESDLKTNLAMILMLLYQDAVNAWLRCGCPSCQPDQGIPIARAWISAPDARGAGGCRVLMVEDRLPYRRNLRPDHCYPAERGCINLAQYIWLPWERAKDLMQAAGVQPATMSYSEISINNLNSDSLHGIMQAREFSYCLQPEERTEIKAVLLDMGGAPWGKRVVGFGSRLAQ